MTGATAARRSRLVALLRDAGLDGFLVTRGVNVRYLTGFTGSAGTLLLDVGGGATLATDGRYAEQAAAEAPDLAGRGADGLVVTRHAARDLIAAGGRAGVVRLAVEAHDVTLEQHGELLRTGVTGAPAVALVPTSRLVERLRAVKDDEEIAALRRSFAIADGALTDLLASGGLRSGRTEAQVAADLDAAMRRRGADDRAFPTIVATGPNGAFPHHRPTSRPLAPGDLVTIDFGALVDGYHSDCTRCFAVGGVEDWQRDLHAVVRLAQDAAIAAAAAGAAVAAVDEAARGVLREAGLADRFVHPVGHGLGLEVHERPILASDGAGTLADRYAVTIEPGVYLPGRYGIRLEDALVVGAGPLTGAVRDLVPV